MVRLTEISELAVLFYQLFQNTGGSSVMGGAMGGGGKSGGKGLAGKNKMVDAVKMKTSKMLLDLADNVTPQYEDVPLMRDVSGACTEALGYMFRQLGRLFGVVVQTLQGVFDVTIVLSSISLLNSMIDALPVPMDLASKIPRVDSSIVAFNLVFHGFKEVVLFDLEIFTWIVPQFTNRTPPRMAPRTRAHARAHATTHTISRTHALYSYDHGVFRTHAALVAGSSTRALGCHVSSSQFCLLVQLLDVRHAYH